MSRITTEVLLARMDARDAVVDGNIAKLTEAVANLANTIAQGQAAQFTTPAIEFAAPTSRPTPSGRKVSAKSFAEGETLAAQGADPSLVLVPAGKFGRGGTQTLTDARAKRAEREVGRTEYLAEREATQGGLVVAVREHAKANTKEANVALASRMRAAGVEPTGQAWKDAKAGLVTY